MQDRTLDKQPDAATRRWASGSADMRPDPRPDAGGNRPDAGLQCPIKYREVLERRFCDRTLAASDQYIAAPTVGMTGCVRSQFHAPGTSLYSIGRCVSASGRLPPASGPRVRSPVCRATGPASGRASSVRSPLRARFFAILRTAWFLSSCLDFA